MKKIHAFTAFAASVALSSLAAGHTFRDSAHAIGLLTDKGGRVQHAAHFTAGKSRYVLIATATVLPPFHGDVRVSLEGAPGMAYDLYNSEPVVDLGWHRQPVLKGDMLHDLRPKDRLALWAVLRPGKGSAATPLATAEIATKAKTGDTCCPIPEANATATAPPPPTHAPEKSEIALAFHDNTTGAQVLRVPIIFDAKDSKPE